jgi:hypothetical protein
MTAEEYEAYVAELVSQLEIFSSATIFRNKEFPGVRQPGKYEIDVAVEFVLAGIMRFLLIIECKNWSRPIDRPIVQKFIQTRDAVSAHKAALVSPVGFTKEAIEVAEAQGIALWVIAEKVWHTVLYCKSMPLYKPRVTYRELRLSCLKTIGYATKQLRACSLLPQNKASGPHLYDSSDGTKIRIILGFGGLSKQGLVSHLNRKISIDLPEHGFGNFTDDDTDGQTVLDSRTAIHEIGNLILSSAMRAGKNKCASNPVLEWMEQESTRLKSYGLTDEEAELLLNAVIAGNQGECKPILDKIPGIPRFSIRPNNFLA